MSQLQRSVRFHPAYDKRSDGFGIHGVQIIFGLTDGKRAVTFTISTDWDLPSVPRRTYATCGSYGASIDYHEPKPSAEGQLPRHDCPWTGGECYGKSGASVARELFAKLVAGGDEAVWTELQRWWDERFGPSLVDRTIVDVAELQSELAALRKRHEQAALGWAEERVKLNRAEARIAELENDLRYEARRRDV